MIPGHGGVSDRMDCQLIMGSFVYFYHQTFLKAAAVGIPAYILSLLSPEEQLNLYNSLKESLSQANLIWTKQLMFLANSLTLIVN